MQSPLKFFLPVLISLGCTQAPPPAWRYIHAAIIAPNCATAGCHSSLTETYSLNLEDADVSYRALVSEGGFVDPGSARNSRLIYLLRGIEVRKPMPPGEPLSDGDIALIEDWIQAGASRD